MDKETRSLLKLLCSYKSLSTKGAIRYWCGDLIGKGLNRDVYVLKQNPDWVVKIQRTISFDNAIEYRIWDDVRFYKKINKWFAECLTITESGLVLVQRRVEHRPKKEYPKQIPKFFTDTKIQNYGWIGDQFVCCDYSNVLDMLTGYMKNDLKKARWWEVENNLKVKRVKSFTIQTEL